MATERIIIQVESRGFKTVQRDIQNVRKSAKSGVTVLQQMRNALVVVAAVRVIRRFTDLADSFINLRNRLQSTLGSMEAATAAQQQIINIARETRTSVDATGDAFARFALGTRDLGVSTNRLLAITKTLNQALILSGATAQEARNGLIQLSQGIASNRLGGDELRAVLEQLPPVAIAIAKELGVTIGQLRTLGSQGKITGEVVLKALEGVAEETNRAFGNTITTIDQALTGLGTNFTVFINNLLNTTGASQGLVGAIGALSNSLLVLGNNTDALIAFGSTIGLIFGAKGVASLLKYASTFTLIQDAVIATAGTSNILKVAWIALTTVAEGLFAIIAANPLTAAVVAVAALTGAIIYLRLNTVTLDDKIQSVNTTLESNRKILDQGAISTTKQARAMIGLALAQKAAAAASLEQARAEVGTGVLSDIARALGSTNTAKDKVEGFNAAIAEANKQVTELRKIFNDLAPSEDAAAAAISDVAKESKKAAGVIDDLKFELEQFGRTDERIKFIAKSLHQAGLEFNAVGKQANDIRALAGAVFDLTEKQKMQEEQQKLNDNASQEAIDRINELKNALQSRGQLETEINKNLTEGRLALIKAGFDQAQVDQLLAERKKDLVQAAREEVFPELTKFLEEQKTLSEKLADAQEKSLRVKRQAIQDGKSSAEATMIENKFIEEQNKLLIENSDARKLADKFFTADKSLREFNDAQKELAKNGAAAGLTISQQKEIMIAYERELAGASNATLQYQQRQILLNKALADGAVSAEEAINIARTNRIELLESQRTLGAGAERSFLKFIDDATDAAAQTEELMTGVFNNLEDSLFSFVKTGKLEFNDLVQSIIDGLIKIGIQQALAATFTGTQSLFGGGGTGGAGPASTGGIGGLVAGFLGSAGLFAANGASFTVGAGSSLGSLPGVDNRLIAFKAKDGETVQVTPKGQSSISQPITVVQNIQTKDADSFRRSESQIAARASASLSRARRRA